MITKPTVLILGAGASMPYGFYSGAELVNKICSRFDNGQTMKLVYDYFEYNPQNNVDKFINELSRSGRQSIDIFLMNRPEYMEIGKVAIAAALITCESQSDLFINTKLKWYQYLFDNLGTDFEEFGKNKLAIITYNYDRSLEFYLKTVLENSYNKNASESLGQLKKIPIIHLHGNLGDLSGTGGTNTRGYDKVLSNRAFSVCENTIKVIHENIDSEDQFTEANKLIKEAETICFLGFGYDKTNMERLCLKDTDLAGKRVFGTAYQMGEAQRIWIKSYFANHQIILGKPEEDTKMFLDNYPIIIRPE